MKLRVVGLLLGVALASAGTATLLDAGAAPPHQTSLSDAASQPRGIGARRLAGDLDGSGRPDTDPRQVVGDAATKSGGCVVAYGRPGQCLPEVPPSQAEHVAMGHMEPHWVCAEVRTIFPKGLKVRVKGADPLELDANRDGKACAKGD